MTDEHDARPGEEAAGHEDAAPWEGEAVELGRALARVSFLKSACAVLLAANVLLLGAVLTVSGRTPMAVLSMPPATVAEAKPDMPVDLPLPGAEEWAVDAGRRIWGFAPGDWLGRLAAQSRFTEAAWKEFEDGEIGITDGVGGTGEASWSQPLAPPALVSEGLEDGVYSWRFSFPVRVWMEVGEDASSREASAEMVVIRRPRADGGFAISRLVATMKSSTAPVPRAEAAEPPSEDEAPDGN